MKRHGDDKWSEVCFSTASFGDIQAGPISSLAIQECAEKFMQRPVASKLSRNIYMDDLLVGVQSGENLDEIIREIDTGLKQANFIIKKWIKTGDVLQQQENVMSVTQQENVMSVTHQENVLSTTQHENVMSVTDTISDHPMVDVSLTSKGPLAPLGGRSKQSTDASFKQNDF